MELSFINCYRGDGWWWLCSCSVMSDSCDPMDCSLPDSSVHGILQARLLEWIAISFSRVFSRPRNWTWVSCIAGPTEEMKPVNSKGNQPWIFTGRTDAEAEAPILWPPDMKSQFIRKDPDSGKDWRQEEKGVTEDETIGWHHWVNGHEFEQTLGGCEGQGSLACCSPWGCSWTWLSDWTTILLQSKPSPNKRVSAYYAHSFVAQELGCHPEKGFSPAPEWLGCHLGCFDMAETICLKSHLMRKTGFLVFLTKFKIFFNLPERQTLKKYSH